MIFRTTWVYGLHGRNFPVTMLRLAREREELAVVNDQIGAPTSASAVASGVGQVLRSLARERDTRAAFEAAAGVYHMTAAGSTTWYEFARRILADDPRRRAGLSDGVDRSARRSIRTAGAAAGVFGARQHEACRAIWRATSVME